MLEPTGRTVMISGANRGLGLAIARHLHTLGYNVSAGSRDSGAASAAMADRVGDRLLCHRYDATEPGSALRWIDATVDRFGGVDVVVNNAGILHQAPLEDLDDQSLDAMWTVNLKGPLAMIREALPHLRASGSGRVVNVSSLSGVRVKGTFAPGYAITKHAVTALSEALKNVGWDDGIRVTNLSPGFVATDMTADFGEDPATMLDPTDVAHLVATVVALPNTASVAQLSVGCRLEPHF